MPEPDDRTGRTTRPPLGRDLAGLLLIFLVAVDSVATLLILRSQHGFELNPLMNWLWAHGEGVFLMVKMLLTSLAVAWLLRRADGRSLRIGLIVGYAIYLPLTALHIYNGIYVHGALVH
jgi:Domain of unknown function (DUF5658)